MGMGRHHDIGDEHVFDLMPEQDGVLDNLKFAGCPQESEVGVNAYARVIDVAGRSEMRKPAPVGMSG